MNAARFARNLIEDGVDPKIAQPLAEHLAEEIERTVATKEHVELVVNTVVTREVQQLRVEMHQEFQRFDARVTDRLDTFTSRLDTFESRISQRFDAFQAQVTQRFDSQSRLLMTSMIVLFLAMLGNILKDFLR
jgi:Mg2+ and Co2+ transporter CorA